MLPTFKGDSRLNVIQITATQFAVLKYLLAPKYYPQANEAWRDIKVRGLHYVLFNATEILDDMDSFLLPHIMDTYHYPLEGGVYPDTYPDKSPYAHQIFTARWLMGYEGRGIIEVNNGRGHHLHSSMRTGKTLSCLWAMDFGLSMGIFKKVLIVSPKTVMRSTWAKELILSFQHLKYTIKENSKKFIHSDTSIDIINWDGLTNIIQRRMISYYDLIIYDECTSLKNDRTKRYEAFKIYLNKNPYIRVWLLTGTPLAQTPMAAYSLAKLISPNLVPKNKSTWRTMTMYNLYMHEWKAKPEAPIICAKALQPSVRFELKDVKEIPDHIFEYVECDKSAKQQRMFRSMAQDFCCEYDTQGVSNFVRVKNSAAKLSKLLQILAGAVYDNEKQTVVTDATPRLEALCDIIDQLPEEQPIVVFVDWIHVQHLLRDYLIPKYKTVEIMNSETPNNDSDKGRLAIERRVQNCETKVVIAHPAICSLGLDFSSTNVVVWYTGTFKNELYIQSIDRIRNLSSEKKGFTKFIIYNMVSDKIERLYLERLKDKKQFQDDYFVQVRQALKDEFAI